MAKKLKNAGYHLVNDFRQSDLIIVNTCSFIEAATSESIDTIFDFLNASKKKDAKVLVAGCMPERYAADLAESLPEVAGFVPCSKEDEIVKIVSDLIGGADDLHPSVKSNCEKGARLEFSQHEIGARDLLTERFAFAHLPMLVNEKGQRLAKRDKSLDLGVMRAQGITASQLRGKVAWLAGFIDEQSELTAEEFVGVYNVDSLKKCGAKIVTTQLSD